MSTNGMSAPCACPNGPADCAQPFCPYYQYVVELLGRRWMGAIIWALLHGLSRFSELAEAIPDISDRMLSERLKELEIEGVIERRVIPETPVRVIYCLTPKGLALEPIMRATMAWAQTWLAEENAL